MGIFDWFKKQAKKENIEVKEDGKQVSVYATVTREESKGIGMEEAQAMQAEIMTMLDESDGNKAMNAACQMLTNGNYEPCIAAFEAIMAKYPEEKATCYNQIGAAYYFLKNYEKAVENYLLSMDNGFDAEMLDYNVWESAEEHFKSSGDKSLLQLYVDKFPNGEAVKQAQKLL